MKITGTIEDSLDNDPFQLVRLDAELPLRDLFAAFALAGMLSKPREEGLEAKNVADTAYWYADAMLAQRERSGE